MTGIPHAEALIVCRGCRGPVDPALFKADSDPLCGGCRPQRPPVLFRRAPLALDRCLACGALVPQWLDARHAHRRHGHDRYPF